MGSVSRKDELQEEIYRLRKDLTKYNDDYAAIKAKESKQDELKKLEKRSSFMSKSLLHFDLFNCLTFQQGKQMVLIVNVLYFCSFTSFLIISFRVG